MNILFKSTKLTPVFLCLLGLLQSGIYYANNAQTLLSNNGHIEVVGDMLIAETDAPTTIVLSLRLIENSSNHDSFPGCGKNKCVFDISNSEAGEYKAIIVTNKGTFSKTVRKI